MTERPDALDDLLFRSGLPEDDQRAVQEHADRLLADAQENPELRAELLPLRALGLDRAVLDLDTMRAAAPEVRRLLVDNLRGAARQLRAGRGTVVVPEDTHDLVRRTVAAAEVLRQWRDVFEAAAKEADAIAEEEALTAIGPLPGCEDAPAGSLFVPDGQGQRIAVSPDWKPGESTWDVPSLVGWLVDDEVSDLIASTHEETYTADDVRQAARSVVARLIGIDGVPGLGKFTPGIKALDALRRRLSEQQRDSDAAVIRQVRSVGLRSYKGVKITREDAP